jgi:hypothetical protein
MEMLIAYGLLIIVGFYTGTATWYRARNSKKELELKRREINLKTASTRLQVVQLRKKYGDELKTELDEIEALLDN